MAITFQQLIDLFVDGETHAVSGSPNHPGTLKIVGDQLIHYNTPILERFNGNFIFNATRYSLQTGQVQKRIKATISPDRLLIVTQVPSGTKIVLKDFYKK